MTWAVHHPHQLSHHGVAASTRPPVHVGWAAVATLVVGAWAGVVAFVGPEFGYHATTSSSWAWTTTNWLLHLVPGAMAVGAGLLLLSLTSSRTVAGRSAVGLAALTSLVAGAWLVVGPALWPWFESSAAYGPATGSGASFVNQVGANLGPGLLLAALGGMALKEAVTLRGIDTGTTADRPADAEPMDPTIV